MAKNNFGTVLRDAREQNGYGLTTVARRLRIRVDVLKAIEDCDFTHMPPKGYTRNMVNAYARFLGLNATELTGMYLDECYAHEIETARKNARPTGFDMSTRAGLRKSQQSSNDAHDLRRQKQSSEKRNNGLSSSRVMYTDDSGSSRQMHRERGDSARLYSEEKAHRSLRPVSPGSAYTNLYNGFEKTRSKKPFIIGGIAVVVVLIIILVLVFGSKGTGGTEEIQKVPVTGSSGSAASDTSQKQTTPTAPTKVVVAYEVVAGQSAYIEVYLDSKIVDAGTVTGPATKSFDVTGLFRLDTTNPDGVKVTQSGSPLVLSDPDGDGVYSVALDFPAVLAQWKKDNPTASTTTSPTSSTSSSSTS